MTDLETLAYLAATDSSFREGLMLAPRKAIKTRGLQLTESEQDLVIKLHHLLALSPPELMQQLTMLPIPDWNGPPPFVTNQLLTPLLPSDSNLWLDEIDSHIIRALGRRACRQSDVFKHDIDLIWQLYAQHLTAVRPLLLLPSLSCEWCGGEGSSATAVAAAWSLYYLAARIQDDIADFEAPSEISSARLSNLATGLIFAASESLLRIECLPLKERLTLQQDFMRTGLQVCLAQHEDLSETTSWQAKEQKRAKAGAALALACRAGARVAGANRQDTIALNDFGYSLGLILQLMDDFHDLFKVESSTDLRQGRVTFPALFAMRLANGLWSERLEQLVTQVSDDPSVEPELRQLIAAVGSLHYWVLVASRCRQAAQSRLTTTVAPQRAKHALLSLMNSCVPWESTSDGASWTRRVEHKYGPILRQLTTT